MEASEYQTLPTSMVPQISNTTLELVDVAPDQELSQENGINKTEKESEDITVHADSNQLKICRV